MADNEFFKDLPNDMWPCPISGEYIPRGTYKSKALTATEPRFAIGGRAVFWAGYGPRGDWAYDEIKLVEIITEGRQVFYTAKNRLDEKGEPVLYDQRLLISPAEWKKVRAAHQSPMFRYDYDAVVDAVKPTTRAATKGSEKEAAK